MQPKGGGGQSSQVVHGTALGKMKQKLKWSQVHLQAISRKKLYDQKSIRFFVLPHPRRISPDPFFDLLWRWLLLTAEQTSEATSSSLRWESGFPMQPFFPFKIISLQRKMTYFFGNLTTKWTSEAWKRTRLLLTYYALWTKFKTNLVPSI